MDAANHDTVVRECEPEVRRIRSECGRYTTEAVVPCGEMRHLYDRGGKLLGRTTWWSNRGTATRIGFEAGFGEIRAAFSYPRFPAWFRRRWISCFDLPFEEARPLLERCGAEALVGFKPEWNCWHCWGFRATAEQTRAIDAELRSLGIRWNGPPMRPGQWEIECPREARHKSREAR